MAEEIAQKRGLSAPGGNHLPEAAPQPDSRPGPPNREQRKLRLVLTAFNIAKVIAVLMVFLLILGMI